MIVFVGLGRGRVVRSGNMDLGMRWKARLMYSISASNSELASQVLALGFAIVRGMNEFKH
jgi:hypothetical protein